MAEPRSLPGKNYDELCTVIRSLDHPKVLLLKEDDFWNFWNYHVPEPERKMGDEGPYVRVMATELRIAGWSKERPEVMDISAASEVSQAMHQGEPGSAKYASVTYEDYYGTSGDETDLRKRLIPYGFKATAKALGGKAYDRLRRAVGKE